MLGYNRNAALLLNLHPITLALRWSVRTALTAPRSLNRNTKQKQRLSQNRLALFTSKNQGGVFASPLSSCVNNPVPRCQDSRLGTRAGSSNRGKPSEISPPVPA